MIIPKWYFLEPVPHGRSSSHKWLPVYIFQPWPTVASCLYRRLSGISSRFDKSPIKLLPPHWVPEHVRFCIYPLRVKSLFSLAFWYSWNYLMVTFKFTCIECLSSLCRTPRLGAWHGDWDSHSFRGTSAIVIILPFVGLWLYHDSAPLTNLIVPFFNLWF